MKRIGAPSIASKRQGLIMKKIEVVRLMTLCVSTLISVSLGEGLDTSSVDAISNWDLESLVSMSEVVVVGRLVPIKIEGAVFGDCYLIIEEDVLNGSLEKNSVLEVSKGCMNKTIEGVGDPDNLEGWTSYCAEFPYLIFMGKKRNSFLPSRFKGLYAYGLVGGVNGIVALDALCIETRSSRNIEKQYEINIFEYPRDFVRAIELYISEKSRLDVAEEMENISKSSRNIYDKLMSSDGSEPGT